MTGFASRSTLVQAAKRTMRLGVLRAFFIATRFVADKPRLRATLRALRRRFRTLGWSLSGERLHYERRIVDNAKPLREQAATWAAVADRSVPRSPAEIRSFLAASLGSAGIVVSVSHDDYVQAFGGVQNVVADEQRAFEAVGWHYLHISPAAPLPVLAPCDAPASYRLRVRLNGQLLGVVRFPDLAAALAELDAAGVRRSLVVHHLKGHVPELLTALTPPGSRPIFWVHDFFSLCPNFNLMRNDVRFCGAPAPTSAACGVCAFGADRAEHLPRMDAYFKAQVPVIAAPSACALSLWSSRGGFTYEATHVVQPAVLRLDRDALPGDQALRPPLRVGYPGASLTSKGWLVFSALANRFSKDPRYRFYQFGADGSRSRQYVHVPVQVTPQQRDAMTEAMVHHRIDVAVIWSAWPETFCFTVHEALAAGAFIVARRSAGNVWPAVTENAPDQGMALDTEAHLVSLFESGEIIDCVARSTRRRGTLTPSVNTVDLVVSAESKEMETGPLPWSVPAGE